MRNSNNCFYWKKPIEIFMFQKYKKVSIRAISAILSQNAMMPVPFNPLDAQPGLLLHLHFPKKLSNGNASAPLPSLLICILEST
jgi:hypothetical protein